MSFSVIYHTPYFAHLAISLVSASTFNYKCVITKSLKASYFHHMNIQKHREWIVQYTVVYFPSSMQETNSVNTRVKSCKVLSSVSHNVLTQLHK